MIRIGKIVATHGLQGAMVVSHIIGHSDWLKKDDPLFIELNKESYIPYFTSQLKAANEDEYIVNLEEVESVEEARKLIGKHIYVQEEILSKQAADSPLLWIGFQVIDQEHGNLGPIEDIMQTASQWLAKLTYKDSEVLIPLVDQTIVQVNLKARWLRVDLPEGLLEVYTE